MLAAKTAERDRLQADLIKVGKELAGLEGRLRTNERAREIVNAVLQATQTEVVGLINELTSLALSAVFGPEYSFELQFEVKRNQSEAVPWIVVDGVKHSPRDEVGGGVLDMVSLALRLSLWAISSPRSAPVFVLDEPGKFLSADKQDAFGRLLKEVSEMLRVQFIVVSHSEGIIEQADKAFRVTQTDGLSAVEEVE